MTPQVDTKALLKRLSNGSTQALQRAVGRCVEAHNPEITVEHFAAALLDDDEGQFAFIAARHRPQALRAALEARIAALPRDHVGRPTFSRPLIAWMAEAARAAAVDAGASSLRSGALFAELALHGTTYAVGAVTTWLDAIPREDLAPAALARCLAEAPERTPKAPSGGASAYVTATKTLLARLGPTVTRALERAAGRAVAARHYEITVPHLVLALLDDPRSDVAIALAHFGGGGALRGALEAALSDLRFGNSGRPTFSPALLQWMRDSFDAAAARDAATRLRSSALLTELVTRPSSWTTPNVEAALRALPRARLDAELVELTRGGDEDPGDR